MDMIHHLLIGIISSLLFPISLHYPSFLLGNIILDIDHLLGFLWKITKKNWNYYELQMPFFLRLSRFKRTPLHSLAGALSLSLGVLLWTHSFFITSSFFLGMLLHLMIDSLDKRGVQWLWPFSDFILRGNLPAVIPEKYQTTMPRYYGLKVGGILSLILVILYWLK